MSNSLRETIEVPEISVHIKTVAGLPPESFTRQNRGERMPAYVAAKSYISLRNSGIVEVCEPADCTQQCPEGTRMCENYEAVQQKLAEAAIPQALNLTDQVPPVRPPAFVR